MDNQDVVKYCIESNSYTVFTDTLLVRKHSINILKASPYCEEHLAAGTKKGLVLLVNTKDMSVLYTLRGHDTEITTLDWMSINNNVIDKTVPAPRFTINPNAKEEIFGRDRPKSIVDKDDIFDLFSYDKSVNEFGTLPGPTLASLDKHADNGDLAEAGIATPFNANFNFAEACQNLRDDIVGDGEITTIEVISFLPIEVLPKFSSDDEEDFVDCDDKQYFLASGAKESVIWIWDTKVGNAIHKIELTTGLKSLIPSKLKF